jgi:hypothetical protein
VLADGDWLAIFPPRLEFSVFTVPEELYVRPADCIAVFAEDTDSPERSGTRTIPLEPNIAADPSIYTTYAEAVRSPIRTQEFEPL